MKVTGDTLLAYGTLLTALGSVIIAVWTLAGSARKDELNRLRLCLEKVEVENQKLHDEVLNLRAENMWLRLFLSSKGFDVPPMPENSASPKSPEKPSGIK